MSFDALLSLLMVYCRISRVFGGFNGVSYTIGHSLQKKQVTSRI